MATSGKIKRTYALSAPLVAAFEEAVPSGERSRVLEELLARMLDGARLAALRSDIEAMCEDMAEVWVEEAEAWRPLEDEVARAI